MRKGKDIILKPKNVKMVINGKEFIGLLILSKVTNSGITHRIVVDGNDIAVHIPNKKV